MDSDDFLVNMGKRIAERRKQLGLSQQKLAEQAYISKQALSTAERGKKELRCENLYRISSILHVSADYLLTGDIVEKDISELTEKLSSVPAGYIRDVEKILDVLSNKK